jgi:NAD+ synthase
MLKDCLYEPMEDMAVANLKPRIRMVILYEYANNHSCLVVGTTNRSEHEIGYFTKHGDGACDIEPIQHLYKTEIFELAKYLGIPDCIINKAPSADLWEGQTDEGEIGLTYKQLDKCLKLWEMPDFDDDDMKKVGVTSKEVERVRSLLSKSGHKRRLPPCINRESVSS